MKWLKLAFMDLRWPCFSSCSRRHCPGVLLINILMSNKKWWTQNAASSSNADCGKTMQHFDWMSVNDFFIGYIRSSIGS